MPDNVTPLFTAEVRDAIAANHQTLAGHWRASGDTHTVLDFVRRDVVEGLGQLFGPADKADPMELARFHDDSHGPMVNQSFAAVAWTFDGVDSKGLWGLAPSQKPVRVRGVTVVDAATDHPNRVHRYIDWVDVMAQLGLSVHGRMPTTPTAPVRKRER